jgi:hypothetical protein
MSEEMPNLYQCGPADALTDMSFLGLEAPYATWNNSRPGERL